MLPAYMTIWMNLEDIINKLIIEKQILNGFPYMRYLNTQTQKQQNSDCQRQGEAEMRIVVQWGEGLITN